MIRANPEQLSPEQYWTHQRNIVPNMQLGGQTSYKGRPITVSLCTVTSGQDKMMTKTVRLRVTGLRTRKRKKRKMIIVPDAVVVESLPSTSWTVRADAQVVARWSHLHGTAPSPDQLLGERLAYRSGYSVRTRSIGGEKWGRWRTECRTLPFRLDIVRTTRTEINEPEPVDTLPPQQGVEVK